MAQGLEPGACVNKTCASWGDRASGKGLLDWSVQCAQFDSADDEISAFIETKKKLKSVIPHIRDCL
jgi:hypothetical protein